MISSSCWSLRFWSTLSKASTFELNFTSIKNTTNLNSKNWSNLWPVVVSFSTISLTSSSGEGYQNPGFQGGYHLQGVGYPFSSCQTKLRGLSVESLKRSNNWASNATNVFLNLLLLKMSLMMRLILAWRDFPTSLRSVFPTFPTYGQIGYLAILVILVVFKQFWLFPE